MHKLLFTPSSFNLKNFDEASQLQAQGFNFVFNSRGRRLSEEEVLALMDEHVVGMVAGTEPLTSAVMEKATSLKVISRCGVGLDNIDLNEAKLRGISIYNTPHAPTAAVAELTIGHILSLSRHIMRSHTDLKMGQWKPMMGSLLEGKTVGIIGFGKIGQRVAQLLEAFGTRILVYDIACPSAHQEKFIEFESVLKQSDIITLHLPYQESTHHMINQKALMMMKPTALLINISRGGLIDENALYEALQEKRIAGAALDCFEVEPYQGPLLSCETILMTAHMGSYAKEARDQMEKEASLSLLRGLYSHGLLNDQRFK